ncbi:MAG: carbohydrate kinase family protein [Candidatus Pacebacteria bacterium]|nr:carbohydrate kinase family protein [Candidatus Paceibacterota bacterium]
MFEVITFGSATQDIFLELTKTEINGSNFCLPLGGKVLVDEMQTFSGGGGTNVACSLANLGIKTAYCGKIGNDDPGKNILSDLAKYKVNPRFCLRDKTIATAVSFIISCEKDRTVLVFWGACHFLLKSEINFKEIQKTKWFYLAPFYEKTAELFGELIDFARNNNIKVAANPSMFQIEKEDQNINSLLPKIDLLLLNKEEAKVLTKNPNASVEETAKIIRRSCPGIIVITQGDDGALVFDSSHFYKISIYKVAVADKTGAGDSFGAGFLAGLLKENNIEYACCLAMVNSAKNISQEGAKNGLLEKAELKFLPKIDIVKERAF